MSQHQYSLIFSTWKRLEDIFSGQLQKDKGIFQNVCPQAPQHQVEDGQEVEAENVNNSICKD